MTIRAAYAKLLSSMKLKSTTSASTSSLRLVMIAVSVVVMAVVAPLQLATQVRADDYDGRIRALEQDEAKYRNEAVRLSNEADSLQREVARFNSEKAVIQTQVDISQAKADKLKAEIKANEEKIAKNKDALGNIIADLYVNDQVSPIEMLASSKGIGDYINKQEYRSITRDQLTTTISAIKKAKAQLEKQKLDVEKVLKDQESQRNLLATKEAEHQKMLDQTRGDESRYMALSADAKANKERLQREQQAAIARALRASGSGGNAVAGDPSRGGYPTNLANSNYYYPIVDPWGMYARQCVSYTAWKVYQKNGYMPKWGGYGNANQWPGNARAAGIPTGGTPRAGSVGVIMSGQYGHVVWVESVNSDGTINISQYNYYDPPRVPQWGMYSEMYNVSPAAYDVYIYF